MSDTNTSSTPTTRLAVACILAATCLLLFLGLGDTPVERTSEKRCHEVAVTMLETGDWLVPYYDGEPRLQKPPLYYWLAAASGAAFGGPNGFTTRLPSALLALATALLVVLWTKRRLGADIAFGSLLLFVTMNQFPSAARRGDAETLLLFSSLLALVAFERFCATANARTGLALAAAMTLAVLAKATAAFLTVLAPALVYLWRANPRPRGVAGKTIGWLALGAAIGFTWYLVIVLRVPGAFDTLFGDLVLPVGANISGDGDAEHYRGPTYYVSKLISVAAPASLFLPVVVWRVIQSKGHRETPAMRFVWLAFAAMFVAFSILPQKQRHYLLPMLPLFAILVSDSLVALARELPTWTTRIVRIGSALSCLLGVAGAAWILVFLWRFDAPATGFDVVAAIAAGLGAIYAGLRLARVDPRPALPALGVALLVFLALHEAKVETYTSRVDFALENDEPVPEAARLYEVERATPWLLELYDLDGVVEDLHERDAENADGDPR